MSHNVAIFACVLAYMVACVLIGLWAMSRTKNTSDFFVAGRSLGVLITGIAIFSSVMSGFGFVGGPGLVYRMGVSSLWIVVAMPIGFCVAFFLLAKRLRVLAEARNSISLPDVAEARYRSRLVRFLVAVSLLFGVVAYLAVQIKAMAIVLQDVFKSNEVAWAGESMLACVVISSAVLVFYCVTGGIIASVYTDLFQGLVMLVAAVLIFVTAMLTVDGGFAGMARVIRTDDAEAMGPWGTLGIFGCLSWYLLFGLGVVGQPHVISKMMMTRHVEEARTTLPLTVAGYSVAALLWISIGLVMRALVLQHTHPALANPDDAAPQFLQHYASPLLAGVVIAGLFAAIMSTADGFLNIGAAAVVHDIPRCFSSQSLRRELLWARIATVALAVLAALFAMQSPHQLIGRLGAFGWGVFASALVPVFAFGLNWKQATPAAAIAAMASALLVNGCVVAFQLQGRQIPLGIPGGAISLLVSCTLFVGISLLSPPAPIDADVEKLMDG